MDVLRRRHVLIGAAIALVAAGLASGVVLLFSGSSSAAPTRAQFLARVAAICQIYGHRLNAIVPPDIAEPANVIAAVRKALPLVKAQERAVRALDRPSDLRAQLARWFQLHSRRIAKLEEAARAGRDLDLRALGVAYTAFILQGPELAKLGSAIGIPHPPC